MPVSLRTRANDAWGSMRSFGSTGSQGNSLVYSLYPAGGAQIPYGILVIYQDAVPDLYFFSFRWTLVGNIVNDQLIYQHAERMVR